MSLPQDDNLILYMRIQQMERDMAELRAKNSELEAKLKDQGQCSQQHSNKVLDQPSVNQEHDICIATEQSVTNDERTLPPTPSAISLSSSSSLSSEDELTTSLRKMVDQLTQQNELLKDSIRHQSHRIQDLEKNSALFRKKMQQYEELLYELQWDPSQDLVAYKNTGDSQTVAELQEKKIHQLLEQMRVMETGLREKQATILTLRGEIEQLQRDHSAPTTPPTTGSPSLKHSSPSLKHSSQSLAPTRLTDIVVNPPFPLEASTDNLTHRRGSGGWWSYVPFFGSPTPAASRPVQI